MVVSSLLLSAASLSAAPRIQRDADRLTVAFTNGTTLSYALHSDLLLGLNAASVDGVALKSADTVQRPIVAQDLARIEKPMIWPLLKFVDAKADGERVVITAELLGTNDTSALKQVWVFSGEPGTEKIHRDAHTWPVLQQPEAICNFKTLKTAADALRPTLKPGGSITITLAPAERNIAGWQWRGWQQHYDVLLNNQQKVGALRQLGTFEIDGNAAGVTVVNMRYRGLGKIEQPLTAAADGSVNEAWMTSETLPGAVSKSPVISPAVPTSVNVNDRGYALRHRAGAWITRMARGAGVAFIDFQYRPHAGLLSFYEKQGNLRASIEVFPGDRCISQTDEETFAQTDRFTTQPQFYVALVNKDKPLKQHEWRTRWQEADQYVRDLVSDELKFVQYEPLPGVGTLADSGWADYYKALANGGAERWAKKGVRFVAFHNPGWINGRYQGPKGHPETPARTGGGVCLVYDWVPAVDIRQPWRDASKAFAKNNIAFLPWFGSYNWAEAPFAKSIGLDAANWSGKADGVTIDDNKGVLPHNYLNAKSRQAVFDRLEHARNEYGFQGFWIDSFQSTGIHRFTRDDAHAPQQRATWEFFAEWSRRGVALMSESHAFPGMSCSIEIANWHEEPYFFQHVWKWYRADAIKQFTPEQRETILFRFMSNKAWTAPDKSYKADDDMLIPSFERFAHEYLAALPDMRRSYVLPDDRGMLWLSYRDNREGVLFAFTDQATPAGVTAVPILDANSASTTFAKQTTYRVKADDLLERFSIRQGTQPDPRLGRSYTMPTYNWPAWAKPQN